MTTSEQLILKQCQTLKFSVVDFLVNLLALQEKDEDLTTPEAHYFLKLHGFSKTKSPNAKKYLDNLISTCNLKNRIFPEKEDKQHININILNTLMMKTECRTIYSIVLVGMGFVDKKISRFKHFEDRIYKKVKFEHFNEEDIKEILESMTELNFTDDAITYLATRTNQFVIPITTLQRKHGNIRNS